METSGPTLLRTKPAAVNITRAHRVLAENGARPSSSVKTLLAKHLSPRYLGSEGRGARGAVMAGDAAPAASPLRAVIEVVVRRWSINPTR